VTFLDDILGGVRAYLDQRMAIVPIY